MALGRLGLKRHAPSLVPSLNDPDTIVAQTAVQALTRLQAWEDCFRVVDDGDAATASRVGALRVLQLLHDPQVVSGLIARLDAERDPERRAGLITALCRLHFVEGEWKGDSWGTRPDTRGPYYQPEPWSETLKITAALKTTLDQANAPEAALIGRELARHRIPAGAALDTLIARAATEPSLLPAIAAQMAQAEDVPASAIPLLIRTATAADTADAARAQAVIALVKTSDPSAWNAALHALPVVQRTKTENNLAEKARNAFANASTLDQVHAVLEEKAAQLDGEPSLLAESALVKLASRQVGSPEARAAATKALDTGWVDPKRRVQILRASAQVGDSSRAALFVAALDDRDADVARAAKEAVRRLKLDPEKIRAEAASPHVADLGVHEVLETVTSTHGEVGAGEQIFAQVGCTGCHTVKADEPLKGPYLGSIAKTYRRRELAEAILIPNKTLAQGFITHHFELNDGSEVDGFVVQEAADAVTIRTVTAQEQKIPVNQIARREKQERSLMPEGLAAGLTVRQFASLLDYLQALSATQ